MNTYDQFQFQNRFQLNKNLIDIVKPFIEFQEDANIREIHIIFGADLPLSSLSLEYTKLLQSKVQSSPNLSKQMKTLCYLNESSNYDCVITILSRINACTPQSADVERLIKANNLSKTAFCASLKQLHVRSFQYATDGKVGSEKSNHNLDK